MGRLLKKNSLIYNKGKTMDKKIINDIADKLEDIKNDTLAEAKKPKETSIDDLIKRLQEAKKNGHKKIKVDGWLYVEKDNESHMIFTNSLYG